MSEKKNIYVSALKTEIFHPEMDLHSFLEKFLKYETLEGKVLAITSKIVSLAEKRLVQNKDILKQDLVKKEADHYLCEGGYGTELTIKNGILIPSAGIDESNSENGDYILYPRVPFDSAKTIWTFLRKTFSINELGIILTDSHSMPLRRGVTGISLAHWGFKPTRSLVGQSDIFRKPLKFTHVNIADSLAAMAVLAMGESDDCTPLALISGEEVEFSDFTSLDEIHIKPEHDLYYPLFKSYL